MLKSPVKIKSGGHILLIPQTEIVPNPNQPRRNFNADELESLAESIRVNGILQPINVRRTETGQFELIAGERRLRAARIVGLEKIPCILIEATEEKSAVYSLIENIQRENLGFFEEAYAINKLMQNFNLSREELSERLGKAQSTISNKLRLLKLPQDVQQAIIRTGLTERHARALLRLDSSEKVYSALKTILEHKMNVTQTDKLIERMLSNEQPKQKAPVKLFKDVRLFVNTLNHAVDTMRKAGIEADSIKSETDSYIEYVVRIPKHGDQIIRANQHTA